MFVLPNYNVCKGVFNKKGKRMSKQRYLDTKFWSDSYIEKLDPIEKLLFIYLMTNERTNLAGIYELPVKYMSVETGIEKSMLENILSRFERDNKVVLFEGWVRLVNAIKHQNTSNVKIHAGIEKILEDVPKHIQQGLKLTDDDSYMSHTSVIDDSSHLIKYNKIELNNNTNTKIEANPEAKRLAVKLHNFVKQRYNFTKERPTEVARSADEIDKLNRLDNRDWNTIEAVLDWSQQDSFWQQNIRSGVKLRQQFDTLLIKAKVEHDNKSSRMIIAGQEPNEL